MENSWTNPKTAEGKYDHEVYSPFPITNPLSWYYYKAQEVQMWSANEIDYPTDRKQFPTLSKRYKELYYDLLGFFAPGDGLVCANVSRFARESSNFEENLFFAAQMFNECVHSEAYGLSIMSIIPDEEEQLRVLRMANEVPAVKRKTDFIKKYIQSDLPQTLRFVAAACSERIFFVTLFAIIFYMRSRTAPDGTKGILPAFTFLNEQIAKDETLHGDYYCDRVRTTGDKPEYEAVLEIIKEAVEIEIEHVSYILREPVDSSEIDAEGGLTIEALTSYAKNLGDQVLVLMEYPTHFNVKVELPWMGDISLSRKTNFYEGTVGNYKKSALGHALDWRKRVGLDEDEDDVINDPSEIDF